jgi:hypothetical protein
MPMSPGERAWRQSCRDREEAHNKPVTDPVLSLMRTLGMEETRENYLKLTFLCPFPALDYDIVHLGAEIEASLPEQFQLPDPYFPED